MKNYLLLAFLILASALTPIFGKLTVAEVSPISLGFLRFSVACILFLITLRYRKQNLKFDKSDYPKLVMMGVLSIPLNQFFFLNGVNLSYASHSGIIYSLNPVFAYLISVTRKTEKFYISKMIAILLTIIGIFFVFYESLHESKEGSSVLTGDFMLVFAVFTFSVYLAFGKGLVLKYGAIKTAAAVFTYGAIAYIPLFIYDLPNLTFVNLTYKGIVGYIFLTVIVAYLAYFVWYYVLKTLQVSKITTFSNLSPLITVFFSVIFLGETISLYLLIGGIITIAGVFLMHRVSLEIS
jgi:drug/metabolite transporter (DMT)-like permease